MVKKGGRKRKGTRFMGDKKGENKGKRKRREKDIGKGESEKMT